MTGDRNYVNLPETCLEKLVKSIQVNLFLADFNYLEPLCAGAVKALVTLS